jgi:phosphatidylglycerol:prolipoprotein diacylglycerol transferase
MVAYHDIDPVAIQLGSVKIHWYGLMYLLGFVVGWWLGRIRARDAWRNWSGSAVDDLLFYIALGVIIGGRLGYVLFYDFARFAADPAMIVKIWQGGMSFHGALIGVILAVWWFARTRGRRFFDVADFLAPLTCLGLAFGRIGNFINGNLWGAPSDLPWAMVFPDPRAGGVPRHPSQLYEALLEGVVLFIIVWTFSRRPRPTMAVSGVFLAGYGIFRFLIEFLRVPDAHIGYLAFDWITMGQVLTSPMIIAGVVLVWLAYRSAGTDTTPPTMPARAHREGSGGKRR